MEALNEVEAAPEDPSRLESRMVHRSHLEACMSLPSYAVAAWSLDAWCSSPLGRWPKYPHRWTRRLVENAHGVSRATATRAKVELRKLWSEVRPGDWMPNQDAWDEPSGQFYALSGELRQRLRLVGQSLGHAAWRLCLHLLVRTRAALAAGAPTLVVSNRATALHLSMSPATVQRALQGLHRLGVVRIVARGINHPRRGALKRAARRIHAFCLLSAGEAGESSSCPEARNICPEAQSEPRGAHNESTPSGSIGSVQQQGGARAPHAFVGGEGAPASPADESEVRAALEVLSVLGLGDTPNGRDVAEAAGGRAGALLWLETERPSLESAANPAGVLVWALHNGGAPGRPSERALRIGAQRRLTWSESRSVWVSSEPACSPSGFTLADGNIGLSDHVDAVLTLCRRARSCADRGGLDEARRWVREARESWRQVSELAADSQLPELGLAARSLSEASAVIAAAVREHERKNRLRLAAEMDDSRDVVVQNRPLREALERLREKARQNRRTRPVEVAV